MRRGTGQYFKSGYGGGATAVQRLGGTARSAAGLFGALSPGTSPIGGTAALDRAVLVGRSADEVMHAIIEAVQPIDGTLDAEASRAAIKDALSELLDQFPDADLLNLDDQQRAIAVERFVAIDVFRRIQVDIGKVVQEKAPTAAAAMSRLREIRDYVKETIASSFRKLEAAGTRLATGIVQRIVRSALNEAVAVFQAYAE